MSFTPGLVIPRVRTNRVLSLASSPEQVIVPKWLDYRSQYLETSNQGNTPQCAAYSAAGIVEAWRWAKYGVYQQIDPGPIYQRAKRLDGMPELDGTTLEAAVEACRQLQLISPNMATYEIANEWEIQRALHRFRYVQMAFQIDDGWMDAQPDGWIKSRGATLGGHAVVCTGYRLDLPEPFWSIQNSWGEGNGWRGFNRMSVDDFRRWFRYALVWDL